MGIPVLLRDIASIHQPAPQQNMQQQPQQQQNQWDDDIPF